MKNHYSKKDLGRSFGLTVCVMLGAQVLLSVIFSSLYDSDGNLPNWAFWLMQGLYAAATGSVSVIYAKASKTRFCLATSANRKPALSHILWGFAIDLCLIAIMLPLNTWVLRLLQSITGKTYSVDMPMQAVPMIIVACALPAFAEEFTFRGTVAQSMKNAETVGGKIGAVALSGALFALMHFNPAQTLHQFVLGATLTLLMFRSGSVWTSVCVHLFNNVVAVVLSFAFSDGTVLQPYYPWLFAVGAVLFALAVYGYLSSANSQWNSDKLPNTQDVFDKTVAEPENSAQNTVQVAESLDAESKIIFGIALGISLLVWILTLFF